MLFLGKRNGNIWPECAAITHVINRKMLKDQVETILVAVFFFFLADA